MKTVYLHNESPTVIRTMAWTKHWSLVCPICSADLVQFDGNTMWECPNCHLGKMAAVGVLGQMQVVVCFENADNVEQIRKK